MEINDAIELLKHHNRWRLGADVKMVKQSALTEAIETIVKHYEMEKHR